jgi:hypothetical protein
MTIFVAINLVSNMVLYSMMEDEKLVTVLLLALFQGPQLVCMLPILLKPSFLYSENARRMLYASIALIPLVLSIDLILGLEIINNGKYGSPSIGTTTSLIFCGGQIMMLVTFIGYIRGPKGGKLAWMLPYTIGASHGGSIYGVSSYGSGGASGYGGGYGGQQQHGYY